ncbi:MAG: ABC transporter ATP-binding protein [Desulfarculaceae bacterium]|nr:ABC transporter ATP-binding protein [Desulfarculaceae bacterium]
MGEILLEVKDLNKAFGKVVTARDLCFNIEAGVLTSIIGPNGAGKSTLINVLTGLLPCDSGSIVFKGEDITDLPTHERVRRGLCRSFQVVNVFPQLSVFENVEIPVLAQMKKAANIFRPVAKEKAVAQRVMELLERTNLDREARVTASELSHGDQRLLEVGIALAAKPSLLFLDEPTAGMNPVERVDILKHIRRISASGETTFVIVEHDMDIVFSLSDRVMVLNRGDIICDGGPDYVKCDKQVRECYLGEEVVA